MSDIKDQPKPVATDRRPAWELVIDFAQMRRNIFAVAPKEELNLRAVKILDLLIEDMRKRDRVGRERYGVPLTAGNGRNHLVDAYQEALDQVVYLRAWLDERGVDFQGPPTSDEHEQVVISLFIDGLAHLIAMRQLIDQGA